MGKPNSNASSKSAWAQFGRGTRGRDVESPSALRHGIHVSEDAQANFIQNTTTRVAEFTPQRRDQLPERPSTSAGPASNSKRRKAEKRVTQDDLLFNPLAAHGKGTTFYNFPLPGSLPTPASSPKDESPPALEKSPLTRPSTPDSMEVASAPLQTLATARMEVPQTQIGMALGSPAHPPTTWHQGHIDVHSISPSPDQMESANEDWSNSPRNVKQKNKGWKLFGGLFGAKKAAPSTGFYQVQPEGMANSMAEAEFVFTDSSTLSEKKPSRTRDRGWSISERRARKDRPDVKRTETAPLQFNFQTPTPSITLEGEALVDNGSKPMNKEGKSLLDVNIPDVQMERYSVMFGSVLGKSATTSSSLLARRQATLDKLKTVNEALAEKEHELNEKAKQLKVRRATSPQLRHSQSPAFSLFPNTPSRMDQSPSQHRNLSSLRRSNTSPAALSPSRPTFAPGLDNEAHTTLMNDEANAAKGSDSALSSRLKKDGYKSSLLTTSPKSKKWSPEESHLMLDSASDIDVDVEQEDLYDPAPFPMKPKLAKPHWQMINPQHSHATAASVSESSISTSSSEHSNSTTASSASAPQSTGSTISRPLNIQSPPLSSGSRSRAATLTAQREIPKPRSRSATRVANAAIKYGEDEQEARLKNAVDVSIARQISVSRQQRQLLVPIKTTVKKAGSVRKARENLAKSERTIGEQSFPVPAGGLAAGTISVTHVSSPLGAVAVAAQVEHDRAGTPLSERAERQRQTSKTRRENKEGTKRLVEGIKPSTPTLVIVGGDKEDREKQWAGTTAIAKVRIAERRKLKEANAKDLTPVVSEIRVGLTVQSAVRGSGHIDHQHRKSERVVVENISTDSAEK